MNSEPHIIERLDDRPVLMDIRGPRGGDTLVFCHGYKGYKDWGCWDLMADYLADSSLCVVKFNFSRNGGTMADPIDFPDLEAFGQNNYSQEVKDLRNVIDAIDQEFGFTNLYLMGHSRGGGITAIVAATDPRVKKLVTLASVSDYATRFPKDQYLQDWKEKGVFYVKNGRTGQEMPHFYQFFEDFDQNREKLSIEKSVRSLEIPYLIIHGSEDEAVNVNEAFNLKKWYPAAELKIIEGAGHTFDTKQPWEDEQMPKVFQEVVDLSVDFMVEA